MYEYHYWDYIKMIWGEAWRETKRLYLTDWRIPASNIASIAVSLYVLYLWQGREAMNNEWAVIVSGLIGAIGGFLFVFLVDLLIVSPAKLYREKETEANILTWNDMEVIAYEFKDSGFFGVGLEIKNGKKRPNTVRNLIGKLTFASKDGKKILAGEPPIHVAIAKLESNQKSFSMEKQIDPDKVRYLAVANADHDKLWIEDKETKEDCRVLGTEKGNYVVTIEVSGTVENCPLKPNYIFKGSLYYDGEKVSWLK